MLESTLATDVKSFTQDIHKKLGGIFAPQRPIFISQVPGRIDIIGGNCASCGGTVVQSTIANGVIVAVQWRMDQRILIRNLNMNKERILTMEYRLDDLFGAARDRNWGVLQNLFSSPDKQWSGHVLGALGQLISRFPRPKAWPGFNIAISSSLPAGAGLGSSAALQIGLLLAIKEALKLEIESPQIANLAAAIETEVMQQPGAPADYLAILQGQKNKMMVVQCTGSDQPSFFAMPEGLRFVTLDSGIRKPAEWQKYMDFHAALYIGQCIFREIQQTGNVRDDGEDELATLTRQAWQSHYKKRIPYRKTGQEFLDKTRIQISPGIHIEPCKNYMPRSAVEYMIEENERAQEFVKLIDQIQQDASSPRWADAGALLFSSHEQYCKMSGVVCDEADWLVKSLQALGVTRGIYGARAMHGGVGSTIVILTADKSTDVLQNLISQYQDRFGKPASLLTGSSAGTLENGVLTTAFV